jgi:hypothetical protein
MKWRRFRLSLGEYRFAWSDGAARAAAKTAFEARVVRAVRDTLQNWLSTDEGQRQAYRPNERVLPSHFGSREGWERYLSELQRRRPAALPDICPDLTDVTLVLDADPDFVDTTRVNFRAAIENGADQPSRQTFNDFEPSIFQVSLRVTLPLAVHRALRLDRVQPSYRFKDWLTYPAMGLNCGVQLLAPPHEMIRLTTTWSPRYVQPRIDPTTIEGLPTRYADLANPQYDHAAMLRLPDEYDRWIGQQALMDAGAGLPPEIAERERRAHGDDLEAYRRESRYVRSGIELLLESRAVALQVSARASLGTWSSIDARAAPWEAWLLTNETFAAYGGSRFVEWRLFQLAFILAHVPTFASRMPEFERWFDANRDELTASLL